MSKRTRLVSLLALCIASPALAQTPPPDSNPPPPAGDQPPVPPADAPPVVTPAVTNPPNPPSPPVGEQPAEPPKVEPKKDDKPPPPVHSKWDATLYGFAELDAIWDSTQGFGELAGGAPIARPGSLAGDHGQLTFTPRNSRIGFKLAAPEANGIKASGQLEMDFFGNQPPGISEASTYGNAGFRIRHMNVKLETPYVDILAGQFWSLFGFQSMSHPNTVAIQGVPGQIYSRVQQIRIGKVIKGGAVDVELQVAANRPAERSSMTPDGVAGVKVMLPGVKAWHTAGSTGSSLDSSALGVSVIGRRFTPPEFSATPMKQASKNGYGVSVDALIGVIPATKKSHAGALTLNGSFVYGFGLADQYTGFNGGVANQALPQPTPAPATPATYTTVLDGGLALYTSDGTLHPIQWTSILGGAQFYINDMVWISANYSHMSSGNAHLFGAGAKVFDVSNWADGNVMADLTPAVRVGLEYSWYNQTYADNTDATDHRVQGSIFYIF
ncbi:MAG: hypothetical protein ABI678_03060 [Kofleriaceae bacterium]